MNIKETIIRIKQMQEDGVIGKYAIGGAVAATFYLEVGDTLDVDVFIHLNPLPGQLLISLDPIYRYFEARGYRFNEQGYPIIADWPVQFLPAEDALLMEALDESKDIFMDGVPVPVFSAEHLAAVALKLGRPKDKLRLTQFLEARAIDESRFRTILERHDLLDLWVRFKKQFAD